MNHPSPDFRDADTKRLSQGSFHSLAPGDTVGSYQIVRFIDDGGFGVVYEAMDPKLNRRVALKIPRTIRDDRDVHRIEAEAQIAAGLNHPNIVRIFQSIESHDRQIIVCELIDGTTLGRWLKAQPRSLVEKMQVFRQILCAIGYAHSVGVVHRDLKPGNILIDENNIVHITDFGLAESTTPRRNQADRNGNSGKSNDGTSSTSATPGFGTPGYMAPEQSSKQGPVDFRTDIYSLGALLFELLVERPAFQGTESQILRQTQNGLTDEHLQLLRTAPSELADLCVAAMQVDPDRRPQSVEEMEVVVDRWLESQDVGPISRAGSVESAASDDRRVVGTSGSGTVWGGWLTTAAVIYVAVLATFLWMDDNPRFGNLWPPTEERSSEMVVAQEPGRDVAQPLPTEPVRTGPALTYQEGHDDSRGGLATISSPVELTSTDSVLPRMPIMVDVRFRIVPATPRDRAENLASIRFSKFDFESTRHGVLAPVESRTIERHEWDLPVAVQLEPGFYEVEINSQSGYTMKWFRTVPSPKDFVRVQHNCLNWYRKESGEVELPPLNWHLPKRVNAKILDLDGIRLRPVRAGSVSLNETHLHRPGDPPKQMVDPMDVSLAPFALGVTEVTVAQFERVMGYAPPVEALMVSVDDLPVTGVTFFEAVDFCEKVGGRLPTWHEYSMVATNHGESRFPWGDDARFVNQKWRLRESRSPGYDIDRHHRVRNLYSSALEWTSTQFIVDLESETLQSYFQPQFTSSRLVVGGPASVLKGRTEVATAFGSAVTFGFFPQKSSNPMIGFRVASGIVDGPNETKKK